MGRLSRCAAKTQAKISVCESIGIHYHHIMSEPIISVSGLRGIVGESLNPEIAMRYALAFSESLPLGPFVVTRDSRPSGSMLADVIHATLNAVGRSTIDAEIAATPTTGFLIRQLGAAGGIQISASHNPIEFNGMKLFSAEGRVLSKGPGEKVLENYKNYKNDKNPQPIWTRYENIGERKHFTSAILEHRAAIIKTVDAEAIVNRRFKVVLDANHGAGAILAEWLLEELNCEVTILGARPDGCFKHSPEPTEENLRGVAETVREMGVDVAFAQDPDADRVAVIDADGRYIGEEYTLALCLDHVLRTAESAGCSKKHPHRRQKGPIVINCATSRMNEDIAKKYGVPIYRSAVGEANVVDKMIETGAMFGGEGNGGPIDPEVGWVRDSFVGMAQILDAMAATEKTVAQLVDEIPRYALVKRKATVELSKVPEMLDKVATAFKDLPCDRLDGLRIDHGDAWVLLRGSNTEPIIRIFAEAPDLNRAEKLCDDVFEIVK